MLLFLDTAPPAGWLMHPKYQDTGSTGIREG